MDVTRREVFSVPADDGAALAVEHIPAAGPGPALGAVFLGHAIFANRRSLDRPAGAGLASAVARAGLHAYTVDWRGHGGSASPPPQTHEKRSSEASSTSNPPQTNGKCASGGGLSDRGAGGWTYEDLVRRDLPAVARFVRARHPGLGLGAVGHSLTGHAALAWLGTQAESSPAPVDALVTIGANVWIRRLEPSRVRWAEKLAVLGLMGALAGALGRLPARALRFGSEDVPRAFVREFRAWAARDAWASPEGTDYLAALGRVRVPVLAVLGAGDRLFCSPESGERFHRHLTGAPLRIHVAGRPELDRDPGHMDMVTDPRSAALWGRIAGWLARALAPAAGAPAPGVERTR